VLNIVEIGRKGSEGHIYSRIWLKIEETVGKEKVTVEYSRNKSEAIKRGISVGERLKRSENRWKGG
jgi:hypothetical protein